MEPSNSNALLACLLLVMLIGSALGSHHGLPERATAQIHGPNAPAEFLAVHNRARATVHVGPLKWSHKLAKEASQLVLCQSD
ncbi:hypothetical protein MRB53_029560 [Persea americana]|uniref:Uncharacterized protein n=1 Tax=Persea americana TaxID=3435 RepID=A0ACC2KIW6_PERAE|nr:hypothetical protein MRB53_029560 [Persea americana]